MTARQELLDFWANRAEYEVHGSAFSEFTPVRTCPECCAAVPADFEWCPLCLEPLTDASLDSAGAGCAESRSTTEGAGWLSDLLSLGQLFVFCFVLGFLAKIWLVGLTVEFYRWQEWWNG